MKYNNDSGVSSHEALPLFRITELFLLLDEHRIDHKESRISIKYKSLGPLIKNEDHAAANKAFDACLTQAVVPEYVRMRNEQANEHLSPVNIIKTAAFLSLSS